ncbi:Concanavalin A-like lectin/glucanase subgroup [Penicillium nucicola]|uniref:Concanavalin A-like lectin/glucanase subgroup n=1 Tax=Penicillium nucicola TaxID=1850975 RepID=UPI002544EAFB|nr:Concanavalin A-like lectin/glucanase subgroup [Penicillium nucicola]KAJ5775010.1 Concanavalin A-like lectin/glucanase subgroup [Penicillium nucicola]
MTSIVHNPIIPGFAPDPSICLIDGTYFLVNSSFHLYPGLPIYSSDDLISWTHTGNAINRPSQLCLARATTFLSPWDDGTTMVATGGLYAPTIRHSHGTTYIICTNVIHGPSNVSGDERSEQFIIHTTDIRSGNWSDPILFPFPGIDPSLLFDDDGRVYVQICKTGPQFQIYNFEINITTGEMISEPTLIWEGWKKGYTEGPHIYKKDGWYYLLCAEGGTFSFHMLSIARSRNVWGPYTSYENNPLYTAHNTTNYVQNTGHGDIFQDKRGQWWAVLLGVRKKQGRSIMGRESFLTAVTWPDNSWPTIDPVVADSDAGVAPNLSLIHASSFVSWVYLRDAKLDRYQIRGNNITLHADLVELTSPEESVTFVGQRQRKINASASVVLHKAQDSRKLRAGLALYKDEHRFLSIEYDFDSQQVIFHGLNKAKSFSHTKTQDIEFQDLLSLKIVYTEASLEFSFSQTGMPWNSLYTVDTALITDYDFTGPVIGVFALGDGNEVKFSDFEIDA